MIRLALISALILSAFRSLAQSLPLIEVPVSNAGDTFAVLLTGDGGWRSIDKQIATQLIAKDIPVVGFLTPEYYRVARSAEESGTALEQVIATYSKKWDRNFVIVIGYSRGADVLPFMLSRLSAPARRQVRLVALLGLEGEIELHYRRWVPFFGSNDPALPVRPEVEKLLGMKILCIYGSKEKHSLCPTLHPGLATAISFHGGHHFGGHYLEVSAAILAGAGE